MFLLAFAVLLTMAVRTVFGERGLVEWWRIQGEARRLHGEVSSLRVDLVREREAIRRIREDDKVLEGLARERLGMVRPGEITYRIVDGEPAPETDFALPPEELPSP